MTSPDRDRTNSIYRTIREFREKRGYSPTYREIADILGISSTSVVAYHLAKLVREGRIRMEMDTARSIEVVSSPSLKRIQEIVLGIGREAEYSVSRNYVTIPTMYLRDLENELRK